MQTDQVPEASEPAARKATQPVAQPVAQPDSRPPAHGADQLKSQPGFRRLGPALNNSIRGLLSAMRSESAFRQELAVGLPLIVLAWWLEPDRWQAVLLTAAVVLVWVVELLNTGLEVICDMITSEIHPAVKKAKDIGSAAVFLSLLMAGLCWGLWLLERGGWLA